MALASAAFLSFMLGGWLLGIGSAPPRPRVAPGPHETELPESTRRRLGALEPRGEPYHVPTPTWLTALRIVAVALYVALAAAWQFTNDVVHACLLMSGSWPRSCSR